MAKNVKLKSSRDDSVQSLVKKNPGSSKGRAERTPRDLKKEASANAQRMERLRMIVAQADMPVEQAAPKRVLRRRPHHRQELERRKSAALFMQVIMMFVILLAVAGWLNQRFHFLGK